MFHATRAKNRNMIELVLEKMLALHGPESLQWANSKGVFLEMNVLQKKMDCIVNILLHPGTTALHLAVKERNHELVRCLLDHDADPSPRMRKDGWTPLHTAANR